MSWRRVYSGVFSCQACGARWVGTWNGPLALMTCRWCDAPMPPYDDDTLDNSTCIDCGLSLRNCECPWRKK